MAPDLALAFQRSQPFVKRLDNHPGSWSKESLDSITDVSTLLWHRKGKRLRPHLVHWFGELAGADPDKLEVYAWAVEALHTASLLHDDVIDHSNQRRGGPTANSKFGNTLPILVGDYLLSDAVERVAEQGHAIITTELCRTLKDLVRGECLQFEWQRNFPDQAVVEQICRMKTASLFRWAASVGPYLANPRLVEPATDFMNSFGALFQFTDDIMDTMGNNEKDSCNDLKEGKINSVTQLLLLHRPALRQSYQAYFAGTSSLNEVMHATKEGLKQKDFKTALIKRREDYLQVCFRDLEKLPEHLITDQLKRLVRTVDERITIRL